MAVASEDASGDDLAYTLALEMKKGIELSEFRTSKAHLHVTEPFPVSFEEERGSRLEDAWRVDIYYERHGGRYTVMHQGRNMAADRAIRLVFSSSRRLYLLAPPRAIVFADIHTQLVWQRSWRHVLPAIHEYIAA